MCFVGVERNPTKKVDIHGIPCIPAARGFVALVALQPRGFVAL